MSKKRQSYDTNRAPKPLVAHVSPEMYANVTSSANTMNITNSAMVNLALQAYFESDEYEATIRRLGGDLEQQD